MASKGQTFNKYTKEFIDKVLDEYKSGKGSSKSLGDLTINKSSKK